MKIKIVKAFKPLLKPYRYKVYYGGRGGAKSYNFARILLLLSVQKKLRILCAREIQKSIRDSVHKLLSDQIGAMKLDNHFTITRDSIISKTGSEFIFKGLRHNVLDIKSTEGIDICWVEEAEKVSEESWDVLIPTIRKENSEIWISFNPNLVDDATYQRFIVNPPANCYIQKVNYSDNPYFPKVLKEEMEYLKKVDYERYLHVWEGECITYGEAQIFKGMFREDIIDTTRVDDVFYGADWGFSVDPTTLVKCYVIDDEVLYIDEEAYKVGCSLKDTPALFNKVSKSKEHIIRADSARPETIDYMNSEGFNVLPVKKGAGSVKDGINYMRSFKEIIIHPRCKHTLEEFRLYNYKTNSAGDILPDVEDKHNHCIDAIRYALEPLIKTRINAKSFMVGGL